MRFDIILGVDDINRAVGRYVVNGNGDGFFSVVKVNDFSMDRCGIVLGTVIEEDREVELPVDWRNSPYGIRTFRDSADAVYWMNKLASKNNERF